MQVWIFAIIFGAIVFALLAFAYAFINRYIATDNSYRGTKVSCSLLIVALLLAILLIPLDVFVVSSSLTETGQQSDPAVFDKLHDILRYIYAGLYGFITLLMFIIMPMCYFYYTSNDMGDESRGRRVFRALRNTIGFIIAMVVIFGGAIIVSHINSNDDDDKDKDQDWEQRIIGPFSHLDTVVTMVVSLLSLIGVIVYVPYLSYGLSVLPIYLIKSRSSTIADEKEALLLEEKQLQQTHRYQQREAQRPTRNNSVNSHHANSSLSRLADKYGHSGQITRGTKDKSVAYTEKKIAENQQKRQLLENVKTSRWVSCWNALGPFRILFGIILLLLSLLFITQNTISLVDRFTHSKCKWSCGFALDDTDKQLINPIDYVLYYTSKIFPIDFIILSLLVLYIFICIVYAASQIGIKLLCVSLHGSFIPAFTQPTVMIFSLCIIGFATLTMNQQLVVSLPQYTTFGSQFYMTVPSILSVIYTNTDTLSRPLRNMILSSEGGVDVVPTTTAIIQPIPFDLDNNNNIRDSDTPDKIIAESEKHRCTLPQADLDGKCHTTIISAFLIKVNKILPFFPLMQFIASGLLSILYIILSLYALCTRPKEQMLQSDDPDAPGYYLNQ